jgi:hypothetical protein
MLLRDIHPGDTLTLRRREKTGLMPFGLATDRLVLVLRVLSNFQVRVLESGAVTRVPCTWLSPAQPPVKRPC